MNPHDSETHLELAALYSAGALPEVERARYEAHLADGCPVCEVELAALRPAIDALADAVVPVTPSAALRERLLARAAATEEAKPAPAAAPARGPRWLPLVAAAAGVALAAVFGAQVFALRGELRSARTESEDLARALSAEQATLQQVRVELDEARAHGAQLATQVASLEATARVLTAPATRTVVLAGSGIAANARARAFLAPDTRTLILYAYDLPALPAGQTYQAWVIPGKTPIAAGVFDPDASGVARHEVAGVDGLDVPITVAVTIEPTGGLPAPSGPIVLAGR